MEKKNPRKIELSDEAFEQYLFLIEKNIIKVYQQI